MKKPATHGPSPSNNSYNMKQACLITSRMIKDFIATSFHVDKEDFDLSPFNAVGGLGKFYQLFGNDYEDIINELNEVLAA